MRLIDADEYEKRIKPYDTEDDMDKALYNFAHYHLVTTPSAQPEPQWIPCSVMLPDGGTECLITVDGKHETWDERTLNNYHVQVAMFTKDLYKIDDCKFYDRKGKTGFYVKNDEGCYHEVEYVTAWMPLPEPYNPDDFSQHMNPPESE